MFSFLYILDSFFSGDAQIHRVLHTTLLLLIMIHSVSSHSVCVSNISVGRDKSEMLFISRPFNQVLTRL